MEPNQPVPNQTVRSREEERTLFSWAAPERPFKRRDREFFTTVLAIAFLVSLIMFFIEGALPVAVVISVVFLVYVLSTVPPETVQHKVSNKGVYFASSRKPWEEIRRFWFTKRFDNELLVFETVGLPGRMEMVINPGDKVELATLLEKYLVNEEAEPNFLDKTASWLSKKVPLEGNKSL